MTETLVLGTAGHIDHGKTTLIRALTGVDCDRLPEEKARGITIELGFAGLELPSGRRLGIVDVPGHEKLVRTMVAGATGIDLVLMVVAADEGVMPQTREHLAICDLLGVHRAIVALTKIDAVDPELAEVVEMEVQEELAASGLRGARIAQVSARSGEGLDELRQALEDLAAEVSRSTGDDLPAWLPVDRVFSMHGFGTVVTGTLHGAPLAEDDTVEVFPDSGRHALRARIRGLQMHGNPVERVSPGGRCAANLQGLDVAQVPRGSILATPGRVAHRIRVDAELEVLPSAPPIASQQSFTIHLGTAERLARVRVLGTQRIEPGQKGFVELRFQRPIAVLEGDRFILRGFTRLAGAGWTVGGGRLLDLAPLRGRRRQTQRLADLARMAAGDRQAGLVSRLQRTGIRGMLESDLRRQVLSLGDLPGVHVGKGRWLARESFEALIEHAVRSVETHHAESPGDSGVGLAETLRRIPGVSSDEAVRAALEDAVARGALERAGRGYRRPGHTAHVSDPKLADRLREHLQEAALAPETLDALAARFQVPIEEVRSIAEHLVRESHLVRVNSNLFFDREAIDRLRERVTRHLETHGSIDPAAYKTLTGQSRRTTVPLMEFFDAERLTVRKGNLRLLRV